MHRSEYMKTCGTEALSDAHRAYYGQYVTEHVRSVVLREFGLSRLRKSTDLHFNDIPLRLWDRLVPYIGKSIDTKMRENGDWLSLGNGVCVLKESARQLVELRT